MTLCLCVSAPLIARDILWARLQGFLFRPTRPRRQFFVATSSALDSSALGSPMKSLLQLAVVTAILVVAYSRGEKVPGDTDTILDAHVKVWPCIDPQEIVDKEVDRWKRIIELSSSASTHPL